MVKSLGLVSRFHSLSAMTDCRLTSHTCQTPKERSVQSVFSKSRSDSALTRNWPTKTSATAACRIANSRTGSWAN